jgi:hypothetical protein
MKKETMIQLAGDHLDCLPIHQDIKELIPEEDAQALLNAGFVDCSWGNDECPSYYNPDFDDAHIMAVDDVDEHHDRISGKIFFIILAYARECEKEYSTAIEAINAYNKFKELNQ